VSKGEYRLVQVRTGIISSFSDIFCRQLSLFGDVRADPNISSNVVNHRPPIGPLLHVIGEKQIPVNPSATVSVGRQLDKGPSGVLREISENVLEAAESGLADESGDSLNAVSNLEPSDKTIELTRQTTMNNVMDRMQSVGRPEVQDKVREAFELLELSESAVSVG